MYIMNRHYNKRAVSNIIAALLLIAIAVAAAILLYVFAIGLLGSLGSSGGTQTKEQVIMEAYSWSSNSLTVTLRNVGSATENLQGADYFINGVKAGAPTGTCGTAGSSITPTQNCIATITATQPAGSFISGASYVLKVVTPTGGVFSYTVICGGAG